MSKKYFVILELLLAVIIVVIGWFLIGYYTHHNYLQTGYEDWVYHAWRSESIAEHGITSWDHIWSNGANHWRAYQYAQHFIVSQVAEIASIPVSKAMLWMVVTVFIGIRLIIYGSLRLLGIGKIPAVAAAIFSYAFAQQWAAMQEFSIFIALITVPLYCFLWALAFRKKKYIYLLAAIAGAMWTLHPVIAFALSGMLLFLILFTSAKESMRTVGIIGTIYVVASLSFFTQVLTSGYSFANPIYSSPTYFFLSITPYYYGFSLIYWIFFALSWVTMIVMSKAMPVWAKVLLLYCSGFILLILLGQYNYLPSFFTQFQFARAIPAIAIMMSFCFGGALQAVFGGFRSNLSRSVAIVLMIIATASAVDIASSQFVAPPVNEIDNPVAKYFSDKDIPRGSVYFENLSAATFFSKKGIRYATSYIEHLQPHPYSTRLRILLRNTAAFSGAPQSLVDTIGNYAKALGIEYIFLPNNSPLVSGLSQRNQEGVALFNEVGLVDFENESNASAILRANFPIHYGYIMEKETADKFIDGAELPLPTIHSESYKPWDNEIAEFSKIVKTDAAMPVEVEFSETNRLIVHLGDIAKFSQPVLIVTQSYDANWTVSNIIDLELKPTRLRFISANLSDKLNVPSALVLENNLHRWHWPVQASGVIVITITLYQLVNSSRKKKKKLVKISNFVASTLPIKKKI